MNRKIVASMGIGPSEGNAIDTERVIRLLEKIGDDAPLPGFELRLPSDVFGGDEVSDEDRRIIADRALEALGLSKLPETTNGEEWPPLLFIEEDGPSHNRQLDEFEIAALTGGAMLVLQYRWNSRRDHGIFGCYDGRYHIGCSRSTGGFPRYRSEAMCKARVIIQALELEFDPDNWLEVEEG